VGVEEKPAGSNRRNDDYPIGSGSRCGRRRTCTVQNAFYKQLRFLVQDLKHPSLRAKKYDEAKDIWQARVNRAWRFYFKIDGNTCLITNVIPHPK
jgi:hypothetical protein